MIRAIVRNGTIQPLDPLPQDWSEGQELVIDEELSPLSAAELAEWKQEMDEASAAIPEEEHEQFLRILAEVEAESKAAVRREWGLE